MESENFRVAITEKSVTDHKSSQLVLGTEAHSKENWDAKFGRFSVSHPYVFSEPITTFALTKSKESPEGTELSVQGFTDQASQTVSFDDTPLFKSQYQSSIAMMQSNIYSAECPLQDSKVVSSAFDHSGGILSSQNGDIKIVIPKGAIAIGDLVKVYVATSLYASSEQFSFPSYVGLCDLVSSFCWIGTPYKFLKCVIVEIDIVAVIDDPKHYCLLSCKDNDLVMQPVDYDYEFETRETETVCVFETTHFCSYCVAFKEDHGEKEAKDMRQIGIYAYQSEIKNGVDEILVELCCFIPLKECISRVREVQNRKGMRLLKPIATKLFYVCYRRKRYVFSLSHEDEIGGWEIDSNKCDKISATSVNFFKGKGGSCKTLMQAEEDGSFPPRFTASIDPSGRKISKLKMLLKVRLLNEQNGKMKQTESFMLRIDMRPYDIPFDKIRLEPVGTSFPAFVDDKSCKVNIEKITRHYDKLSQLSFNEIRPLLRRHGVITSFDVENIDSKSLNSDKMHYLLEDVLIKSLKSDVQDKYDSFLKSLDESENSLAKTLAQCLSH